MEKQAFTKILIFLALLSLVGCADNNKQPIVVNDKPVSVVKTDEPETSPKEEVVMVKEPVPVVVKKAEPVEVKKDDSVRVYQAKGSYVSPAATEHLDVKVSMKNGLVQGVEMTSDSSSPKSLRFQGLFLEGVKTQIIGKKISEIGEFTRVNGSSLTGEGFNQAIAVIKSEAAK